MVDTDVHTRRRAGAEVALGKARALAPGNAAVLVSASELSSTLGRLDQALAFARRAVELDPLSSAAQHRLAVHLMRAGRLEEARETSQRVLDLQPGRGGEHLNLGLIELKRSRPEEALALMKKDSAPHWRLYGSALAYHALGRRGEADAALMEMTETYGDDAAFQLAEIHAVRGELDAAFAWLERAYSHHDPGLQDLKVSEALVDLHDDPRWLRLVEKVGLPR